MTTAEYWTSEAQRILKSQHYEKELADMPPRERAAIEPLLSRREMKVRKFRAVARSHPIVPFLLGVTAGILLLSVLEATEKAFSHPGPRTTEWFASHADAIPIALTWCKDHPDDVKKHAFGPQTCENVTIAAQGR